MKIVIPDGATVRDSDVSLDCFKKYGEVIEYDLTDDKDLAVRIADADILLCNKSPVTREVLKCAKNLKYIGLFATGYNNIDIASAKEFGVTVCNVPSYSTEAVAQQTFALLLAVINRVGEYNKMVLEGDWIKSSSFAFFPLPLSELSGKTLGIIGYGSIGRRVADIAKAFGMKVLVRNRRPVNDETVTQVDIDTLLKESDVVSMHCPLNDDSKGMMNREAFAKMKDGAVFINTARGALVDEEALRDALESGHLKGAGVDVLCNEPMDASCPLYKAKNCYITPHVAWAGVETRKRLLGVMEENIKAFLSGNPINVVNK